MNKRLSILFVVLIVIIMFAASHADAQTLGNSNQLGQAATSQAIISPGALQVNTAAPNPFTAGSIDQQVHTNQAASTAPAFGVQGMGCSKPGSGFTAQIVGGGVSTAIAGETDPGCDAPRDINTMKMVNMPMEDQQRRACMVPAIAKASLLCKQLAIEDRPLAIINAIPVASADPYIAERIARTGR